MMWWADEDNNDDDDNDDDFDFDCDDDDDDDDDNDDDDDFDFDCDDDDDDDEDKDSGNDDSNNRGRVYDEMHKCTVCLFGRHLGSVVLSEATDCHGLSQGLPELTAQVCHRHVCLCST